MSCHRCAALCVEYRISTPSELQRALAIARENLADATIEEMPCAAVGAMGAPPFSEVSPRGPWRDVLDYRFRCTTCAQVFELHAETYHGSGGAWRPKDPASVPERVEVPGEDDKDDKEDEGR